MPQDALSEVSKYNQVNSYKKTQTLYVQGNPVFGLYSIHKGIVKLTQIGMQEKETLIRIEGEGDVLGGEELFNEVNYHSTATVLEDAEICFFSKEFIDELVGQYPSVARNLLKELANKLCQSKIQICTLTQKKVTQRLAEQILSLADKFGSELPNGNIIVHLTLTRNELAGLIGTSREAVTRALSGFLKKKLVKQKSKQLIIVKENALKDIAFYS